MIMIVTLFEESLNMNMSTPIDLLYLGSSIALIALVLYLTHVAEHGTKGHQEEQKAHGEKSVKEEGVH